MESTATRLVCANWIDFGLITSPTVGSIDNLLVPQEETIGHHLDVAQAHSFILLLLSSYVRFLHRLSHPSSSLRPSSSPYTTTTTTHWSFAAQDSDSVLTVGLSYLRLHAAGPPSYPSARSSPSAQKAKVRAHLEPAHLQPVRFCPVLLQICKESPSPGRTPKASLDCPTRACPSTHPGPVEGDDQ